MGWNHQPGLVLGSAPEVKAVGLPIYHTGVEAERAVGSDDCFGYLSPRAKMLAIVANEGL